MYNCWKNSETPLLNQTITCFKAYCEKYLNIINRFQVILHRPVIRAKFLHTETLYRMQTNTIFLNINFVQILNLKFEQN